MKKNILLVEYNTSTIEAIQQILHQKIFEITVASTEEVARNLLGSFSFDLLITETLLPKSHGFFLSKYVSDNYPDMKIIIISEKLKKADCKDEAITLHGANDFFEKPLNEKEFKSRVLELLNMKEEELHDIDFSSDITTRKYRVPTSDELEAFKEKFSKKDTNGEISKDIEDLPVFKIDLD